MPTNLCSMPQNQIPLEYSSNFAMLKNIGSLSDEVQDLETEDDVSECVARAMLIFPSCCKTYIVEGHGQFRF